MGIGSSSLNSLRLLRKFVLHPLIHTLPTRNLSTEFGSLVSKEKVWIKVCNLHFPKQKAEPFLTLPLRLSVCSHSFLRNYGLPGLTTLTVCVAPTAFPQLSSALIVHSIWSSTPPESRMVMVSPLISTTHDSVLSIRLPFLVKK